jgi:DNA-directed RNA polymerase subunit RPC12/RpoP
LQQSFPCPKCGAQIAIGQNFCGACGQRFEYRCRHCGTPVGDSPGFCANCGGKLSHMPRSTQPAVKKALPSQVGHPVKMQTAMQTTGGHIGRYFIVVAVLFVLVVCIYLVGSSTQGSSSDWMGGYSFGGQSPASTPPANGGIDNQQKPTSEPKSDSPSYSVSNVIAATRNYSPTCQLLTQTRRTG